MIHENDISGIILDSAIEVHRHTGPGLLESVYEELLLLELGSRGLKVQSQVRLPAMYKSIKTEKHFIIDILVVDSVVVELKSVKEVTLLHRKQLLTYLTLSQKKLGLLINFNTSLLKHGVTRVVNNL